MMDDMRFLTVILATILVALAAVIVGVLM